jgi:AmmeMemoRadiSam system protein B/AmmeMemoRadiSam system protein A
MAAAVLAAALFSLLLPAGPSGAATATSPPRPGAPGAGPAAANAPVAAPSFAPAGNVRPAALAGSWYPDDQVFVQAETHRMLRAAPAAPSVKGRPVALVVPHAGWRYSGALAATAFRTIRRGEFDRVVLVAPSHHARFKGYSIDGAAAYRTPLGDIPLCRKSIDALSDGRLVREVKGAAGPEHAVEIELPFLQETLAEFLLVPILVGDTTPEQERALAERLATLHDGRTLFVFSSDFTHYGPRFDYAPFGGTGSALARIRELNNSAIDHLRRIDSEGFRAHLAETGNTICGRNPLRVMLELLPKIAPKAKAVLLGHYASGEMGWAQGDNSVSYVAMAYTLDETVPGDPISGPPRYVAVPQDAPPTSDVLGRRLVRLARATLQTRLGGSDALSQELSAYPRGPVHERLQGAFVTLERTDPKEIEAYGRLRGCTGQIIPKYPLYEAVAYAALTASLHDRRFRPVQPEELDRLEVSVTVLSPQRPIEAWKEIRLGEHGIILEKDGHRAVFLPQVPGEQGWNLEQTLTALARKAGLSGDAWREDTQFMVFTGQVFREGHSS